MKDELLWQLRDHLVKETMDHIQEKSPFYQNLYRGIDLSKITKASDLKLLPVLRKEDLKNVEETISDGVHVSRFHYTSGTTGEPFRVAVSEEELEIIADFFGEDVKRKNIEEKYLGILLSSVLHGAPSPVPPSHVFWLNFFYYDEEHFKHAAEALLAEHNYPGVRKRVSIAAGVWVQELTYYLLKEGYDLLDTEVNTLINTGLYLTPKRRTFLRQAWGIAPTDRYSLAEIFGGATECDKCGGYHFDPMVIPEVVNPVTLEPVSSGYGAMVLTSPYPFRQAQPMIRYWTGDLVEVVPSDCVDDVSILPKGRLVNTYMITKDHTTDYLMIPSDVYSAIDGYPDVARGLFYPHVDFLKEWHDFFGFPRWNMKAEKQGNTHVIRIQVELKYHTWMYPKRVKELQSEIEKYLLEHNAVLKSYTESGKAELTIDLLSRGSIKDEEIFGLVG
jgi:hypothetical protein